MTLCASRRPTAAPVHRKGGFEQTVSFWPVTLDVVRSTLETVAFSHIGTTKLSAPFRQTHAQNRLLLHRRGFPRSRRIIAGLVGPFANLCEPPREHAAIIEGLPSNAATKEKEDETENPLDRCPREAATPTLRSQLGGAHCA